MKPGLPELSRLAESGEVLAEGMPRRDALRAGLGALVAVSIVSIVPRKAVAAADKVSKASVQYTDTGTTPGKDCDDCSLFVPGKSAKDRGTCKIVEGDISPHGHCLAFTPKPKG
jgi:hypothetical protein